MVLVLDGKVLFDSVLQLSEYVHDGVTMEQDVKITIRLDLRLGTVVASVDLLRVFVRLLDNNWVLIELGTGPMTVEQSKKSTTMVRILFLYSTMLTISFSKPSPLTLSCRCTTIKSMKSKYSKHIIRPDRGEDESRLLNSWLRALPRKTPLILSRGDDFHGSGD